MASHRAFEKPQPAPACEPFLQMPQRLFAQIGALARQLVQRLLHGRLFRETAEQEISRFRQENAFHLVMRTIDVNPFRCPLRRFPWNVRVSAECAEPGAGRVSKRQKLSALAQAEPQDAEIFHRQPGKPRRIEPVILFRQHRFQPRRFQSGEVAC